MSYFLVYTILLLSLVSGEEIIAPARNGIRIPKDGRTYDFDFIYNYTKYLHGIHNFNSFVTFAQPHTRFRPNFLVVRSLERALVEDFNVPIIVWGKQRTAKFRQNIGLNNLVFVQISNITDPILDVVDYTLEGLHFISMLFFYKDKENRPPSAAEIHAFFAWCWSKNMVNVALTFQVIESRLVDNYRIIDIRNHVYTYTPFPKLTVFNLTEDVRKGGGSFAIDRIKKVKNYTFKTRMLHHPPFVFMARKGKNCKIFGNCSNAISGTSARLYAEYIHQIGGTIEIIEYHNLSIAEITDKILLAAAKKEVHIGIHPFSDLLLGPELSEGSYPIGQTNVCTIIPVQREMPRERYFVHSFQPTIWLLTILTVFALFGLQFFFSYAFTSQCRNPLTICGYAIIATASIMLDQACTIGFFRANWPCYKLVHLVILLMIFVLNNTYTASLTSLFSTAPFDTQVDNVEQFLASELEILVSKSDRELYFDKNYLPAVLTSRLRVVDRAIVYRHLGRLNTSYAYLASAEQWKSLDHHQQHLIKPLFRMPSKELCTPQFYLKLPLQWDSPFANSLALFFMITRESGFSLKWEEMSNYDARKLGNFTPILNDIKLWKPLGLGHFLLAGYFILFIWILAILCFIAEIFWYKITRKMDFINVKTPKRVVRKKAGKYYSETSLCMTTDL